ncbi:hypothetical protein Hamer_G001642 [Homarus americanus]|uniref:Uncharacterized protein n=1 Tax=Homarus americanus TaxID=6706 RepID=A0A8J5MQS0_HOMAM|nr:hypothetical protein Hamer_G001642 [Homarus americanus]
MGVVAENEYRVLLDTAGLALGRFLLVLGVALPLILVIICICKHLHLLKKSVPLPTPPVCRRQLSANTVYPPTSLISRQQLSIYTICRPAPPDNPLTLGKSLGKITSPINKFHVDTITIQPDVSQRQQLGPTFLSLTPPLQPHHAHVRSTCSQPGQHQPVHNT